MPVVMPYKLVPPRTEGQVLRHRQVGALDERLQRHELVWLLGLPGAGKTSVAAQWLARAEGRRSVWYRLDEDDADIAGLLDALRRHPVHGDAARLPAWSPEHQTELRSFARQFFQQWLALAPEPLTLVFDDCHRLPEDAPLFELLDAAREVAAGTQGRLSFLLISRRPPGLPLSRGLVPGWLSVYDDLPLARTARPTSSTPTYAATAQATPNTAACSVLRRPSRANEAAAELRKRGPWRRLWRKRPAGGCLAPASAAPQSCRRRCLQGGARKHQGVCVASFLCRLY